MEEPALSRRLSQVAHLVSPVPCMADIGSDHGLVPLALFATEKVQKAIAVEVTKGPFETVAQAFRNAALGGRLEARLGNGLLPLRPGEVQSVVIAGMGGGTIWDILTTQYAQELLASDLPELILQPMDDSGRLRYFAKLSGYQICADFWLKDRGLIYHFLKLRAPAALKKIPSNAGEIFASLDLTERLQYEFGPLCEGRGDEAGREFLQAQIDKRKKNLVSLQNAKGSAGLERRKKIQEEYDGLIQMLNRR